MNSRIGAGRRTSSWLMHHAPEAELGAATQKAAGASHPNGLSASSRSKGGFWTFRRTWSALAEASSTLFARCSSGKDLAKSTCFLDAIHRGLVRQLPFLSDVGRWRAAVDARSRPYRWVFRRASTPSMIGKTPEIRRFRWGPCPVFYCQALLQLRSPRRSRHSVPTIRSNRSPSN